jgi:hypothetical protein
MIRKKVRVPSRVEFEAAVQAAAETCVVRHEDSKRRYFVAECEDEARLDPLRDLGCEITEDRRYVPDRPGP